MSSRGLLPGETPIDGSGLKLRGISTRAELNQAEAEPIIGSHSLIRDECIAAIRAADLGDEEPLIELHQRFTART